MRLNLKAGTRPLIRAAKKSAALLSSLFAVSLLASFISLLGPATADPNICINPETREKITSGNKTTVGDQQQRCCRRRPIHGRPTDAILIDDTKFRRMQHRNRCWGAGFRSVDLLRVKIRPEQ
jgi:hypothetical protein